MALQKQSLPINFAQGIETKVDPKQLPFGKFSRLVNSVFTKIGRLTKRFGFKELATAPDTTASYVTTFNDSLLALSANLASYESATNTWRKQGYLQPLDLVAVPLYRGSQNYVETDAVVSPNGLVFTVVERDSPNGYFYQISDVATGHAVVPPTAIPFFSVNATSVKAFVLGNYFIALWSTNDNHLQYFAINYFSLIKSSTVTLQTNMATTEPYSFDGFTANNSLYIAYNASDGGGAIRVFSLSSTLIKSATVAFATQVGTIVSVCADITGTTPVIYVSYYDAGGATGHTLAVNQNLSTVLAPTSIISSGVFSNITSSAQNGLCTVFYEAVNTYSYGATLPTDFINMNTVTQGGTVSGAVVLARSVGLGSKSFIYNGDIYVLGAYSSAFQPTYFLLNSAFTQLGATAVAMLAYSNGGGYYVGVLPSATVINNTAYLSYLFRDLIQPVNKGNSAVNGGAGVYSQYGVNLAAFTFGTDAQVSTEIGNNLHFNGGFLWMYDGIMPVEHNFQLYPDNVVAAIQATSGGHLIADTYFYVATYEWIDARGNTHVSAPSLPSSITTTGTTSIVRVNIPTLRLTYKTNVVVTVYRYSVTIPIYYQVTGFSTFSLSNTNTDSIHFDDDGTYRNATGANSIEGNNILYTTGGVVENIGSPAFAAVSLYGSRLFGIDAEDRNLLWFSKQVIEATPVEMSDLFTLFISPTQGAQGSTGVMTALSAMDDKLIIFKKDAIYYMIGVGPDNTGSNNDFSNPIFITATVGTSNQRSVVFTPEGLMFQSKTKGIWLLARNLQTLYIGSPVADFNEFEVVSALAIPGTNQVRFVLSNGVVLMYDYFQNQWGTFEGISNISSTLFQDAHTCIDSYGRIFQESAGTYLDGTIPVVMSLATGWMNMSGLQGFERGYWLNLVGTYISPHTLAVSLSYDYNDSPTQVTVITPDNYSAPYGGGPLYGSPTPYGGSLNIEQWRVFFSRQKCEALKISIAEMYDATLGVAAGEGLNISGINLMYGVKGNYPRLPAARSVG